MCFISRVSFLFVLVFAIACRQDNKQLYKSLAEYDLNNPYIFHLRDELDEISGIHYYPKDTSVFAINDENGLLYKVFLRKQVAVMKWKFADQGDYEDISLVDSTFYVLQSNGNMISFNVLTKDSVFVDKCKRPYEGKNEFESLYFDPGFKTLVMICKDCEVDDKKTVSAWSFNPVTRLYSDTPLFVINARNIFKILGEQKEKFKPSAAAINPVTGDLYILSAVNKILAVSDRNGNIKRAVALNPKYFKQPEGLTFSPKGDMLISNEFAETGGANVMLFKYKSAAK